MTKAFVTRSGTTNKGTDYEILNIANIIINLVTDEEIEDFHISSNDVEFGDFDDIVVETETSNGSKVYALQLKHSERGNLSLKQLAQSTGNFSIKKYFHSAQTIKNVKVKFILYTNLRLNVAEGAKFYLDGENFPITLTKIYPKNASTFSQKTTYCYKLAVVEDACSYEYSPEILLYKRFFQKLFLYVDQENANHLKQSVTKKFQTCFCGSDVEYNEYIIFLDEWKESGKEKLNKKWMKLAIALKILSSRIRPLSFDQNSNLKDAKITKLKLLREVIELFDISIFRKESYEGVKKLWHDVLCELTDLKIINKLRKKYQLTYNCISNVGKANPLILSILLWLMGKCPLIVKGDASVYKVIELCEGQKFLLLKDECESSFNQNISVFKFLSDLKPKTNQYNQLVQNFACSLQDKEEISLESLIKHNEDILTVLKTDDLLEMLEGQCIIGEVKEKLAEPYIERCLLKNTIDVNIFDNITVKTAIILDCVTNKKVLESRLRRHNFINIHDFLTAEEDQAPLPNIESGFDKKSYMESSSLSPTIYFSEKQCSFNEFKAICNRTLDTKSFHQFRIREQNLEWIRSRGDVNDLEKYNLSHSCFVKERDLIGSKLENNINLVISDPGMGKSELMKSLKNKRFPDCFTIIIDPKDVYSFFKNRRSNHSVDNFQKFLLNQKCKTLSERDTNIFKKLFQQNRIVYLWDALDEVLEEHRNIIINIIVKLSEKCLQWVTSRCHLQNILQKKFNVLCLKLSKFDEEDQRNYIHKRLINVSSVETIEIIIKNIESSFVLVEHKDILGIPLQLFMLTELFRQDQTKYSALLNNFFILTDLYEYFIEEKISIYYKDKVGLDLNTSFAELWVQNHKNKIFEEYTTAALVLLFPEAILTSLVIEQKHILQNQNHTNVGLFTQIKDQIPQFLHNSFAEYLAARYFFSKLEDKNILVQVMFDPKYINVRFFFDLLFAGDSKTHVAILYKNFEFVRSCNNDLTSLDCGGRSVLHLAFSWGQRYPELDVKHVDNTCIVDDKGIFSLPSDKIEYLEVIDFLLEKCDSFQQDQIYNMTPEEYARRATCLVAEMRIIMNQNIDKSVDKKHIVNMLYYSTFHGYYEELSFFLEFLVKKIAEPEEIRSKRRQKQKQKRKSKSFNVINSIKNNTGQTLLSIAITLGHLKIVEFLVKSGSDIDLPDEKGLTPLNTACVNGHYTIAQFLVKNSANINLPDKKGFTPVNSASWKGEVKIVKFLIESGANIDQADKDGDTPLKTASWKGHLNIVKLLVEAGANINSENEDNFTPLNSASCNGHEKIVEFLVEANADINLQDIDGFTPLNTACANGHYKIVELLVEAGTEIDLPDKNGFTPLNSASWTGHYDIVKLLVKAGAGVNLPDKQGFTPLNAASWRGHDKIVTFLVGAGGDITIADINGLTPLYAASANGHLETVRFLVKSGADVSLPDANGFTPLNTACWNRRAEIVRFLLKAGADVNSADKHGFTPINSASWRGDQEIVETLIEAGADIHLADTNGFTPLYASCLNGHRPIVELLVRASANTDHADEDGNTPLHVASLKEHYKIVEFLVKAGANVNLATKDGATPLNIASRKGHEKIVKLLVQAGADIERADEDDNTPFNAASSYGHGKVVEVLAKAGANSRNKYLGVGPLISASTIGHYKPIEVLDKENVTDPTNTLHTSSFRWTEWLQRICCFFRRIKWRPESDKYQLN